MIVRAVASELKEALGDDNEGEKRCFIEVSDVTLYYF
jgi:hypothetical protein